MLRSRQRAALALVLGLIALGACGGTVTNVGSILVDGGNAGADGATPLADGSATTDADAGAEDASDAHASCPGSQCIDVDGAVHCEGDHGTRACTTSAHTEICTCGGTMPSHWINCGGCP